MATKIGPFKGSTNNKIITSCRDHITVAFGPVQPNDVFTLPRSVLRIYGFLGDYFDAGRQCLGSS